MSNPLRAKFTDARTRLEEKYLDTVAIEIAANKIPAVHKPTLLDKIRATKVDVAELVHITLEESK